MRHLKFSLQGNTSQKATVFSSKHRTFVAFNPIPRIRTPVQNGQCTLPLGNAALRISKFAPAGISRDSNSAQGRDKKDTAYYHNEQKVSIFLVLSDQYCLETSRKHTQLKRNYCIIIVRNILLTTQFRTNCYSSIPNQ
jgi:hypothetical protein